MSNRIRFILIISCNLLLPIAIFVFCYLIPPDNHCESNLASLHNQLLQALSRVQFDEQRIAFAEQEINDLSPSKDHLPWEDKSLDDALNMFPTGTWPQTLCSPDGKTCATYTNKGLCQGLSVSVDSPGEVTFSNTEPDSSSAGVKPGCGITIYTSNSIHVGGQP